jgi:hypothetical protein
MKLEELIKLFKKFSIIFFRIYLCIKIYLSFTDVT